MDRLSPPKFVYKREQKWRLVDLLQLHDVHDSAIQRHYAESFSSTLASLGRGADWTALPRDSDHTSRQNS
jgi:hypothetical protein